MVRATWSVRQIACAAVGVVLQLTLAPASASAATPKGTVAALLLQVIGLTDENPGRVSGGGFGCGGSGTLDGGPGPDIMHGGKGVDTFSDADGERDVVNGGDDCDGGVVDLGLDVMTSVEMPNDVRIVPLLRTP
jgi:hypothetical protein